MVFDTRNCATCSEELSAPGEQADTWASGHQVDTPGLDLDPSSLVSCASPSGPLCPVLPGPWDSAAAQGALSGWQQALLFGGLRLCINL